VNYDAAFLDHFQHPRRQGALDTATHRGMADDDACGDRLWLDLRLAGGTVEDARFRVEGCIGAIAAGSALASLLVGRDPKARPVEASELEALLGEVPRAKRHALGLALRALESALQGRGQAFFSQALFSPF